MEDAAKTTREAATVIASTDQIPGRSFSREERAAIARLTTLWLTSRLASRFGRMPKNDAKDRLETTVHDLAARITRELYALPPDGAGADRIIDGLLQDIAASELAAKTDGLPLETYEVLRESLQRTRQRIQEAELPRVSVFTSDQTQAVWQKSSLKSIASMTYRSGVDPALDVAEEPLKAAIEEHTAFSSWADFDAAYTRLMGIIDVFDAETAGGYRPYADAHRHNVSQRFHDLYCVMLTRCDFQGAPTTLQRISETEAMEETRLSLRLCDQNHAGLESRIAQQ